LSPSLYEILSDSKTHADDQLGLAFALTHMNGEISDADTKVPDFGFPDFGLLHTWIDAAAARRRCRA
jgi:hypothetical protein